MIKLKHLKMETNKKIGKLISVNNIILGHLNLQHIINRLKISDMKKFMTIAIDDFRINGEDNSVYRKAFADIKAEFDILRKEQLSIVKKTKDYKSLIKTYHRNLK